MFSKKAAAPTVETLERHSQFDYTHKDGQHQHGPLDGGEIPGVEDVYKRQSWA